ncbi:MAG: hypothetical protein LEGION0403_FIIPPAGN_02054 [Legionella sp.]|uniref:Rossmann-like and DUF2520 domain-containing protein n=1 Tax=Legionella sp. TaxID=459 RepID=UPI003D11726D
MRFNIIGAGNLGKTIGYLFGNSLTNQLQINSICNTSLASSDKAVKFIGAGYPTTLDKLTTCEITLISVQDDLIEAIAEKISAQDNIIPGSIFFHCSGSLTSDALKSLRSKGAYVASIHPMKSFASPELSITNFKGTFCAMEGDQEALSILEPLFTGIGAFTYHIEKSKKSLYHAAGVFASNYLVTLSQKALECLTESGVENNMAMQIITNIMKGTISNLATTLSPEQSLTGPIKRGDVSTIKKHISAFSDTDTKEIYTHLGKETLKLAGHDENVKDSLTKALTSDEPSASPKYTLF